jgi:hypothetical protein
MMELAIVWATSGESVEKACPPFSFPSQSKEAHKSIDDVYRSAYVVWLEHGSLWLELVAGQVPDLKVHEGATALCEGSSM